LISQNLQTRPHQHADS